jgi:hypothetical protein
MCPKCGHNVSKTPASLEGMPITNFVPQKGSPEWYKGKWFRRTEREWHDDIRSRVKLPDGKIVRRRVG